MKNPIVESIRRKKMSTKDHVEQEPSQYSEDFLSHDGEEEEFPEIEYDMSSGPSELPEEDNKAKAKKALAGARLARLNKREG